MSVAETIGYPPGVLSLGLSDVYIYIYICMYICMYIQYMYLICIYLYFYILLLVLSVCTKGLRVTQFQFSVCMYGTCGRIDNKADFDFWLWLPFFCGMKNKIFLRMLVTEEFWLPLTSIKWTKTHSCSTDKKEDKQFCNESELMLKEFSFSGELSL